MNASPKPYQALGNLSLPRPESFLAADAQQRSETEAPPESPPQTEPDTTPSEPAPSPEREPDADPDHIEPTVPLEEPKPDDLPDRPYTTCPVYPRKTPCG